jgi:UDP-N-acetylglucosamine 2-epimerase
MCASLAAFYQKIPVAHLEAGLRTDSLYSPFPEEINRRIISQIASLHWAPTARAAEALRRENLPLPPGRVLVTGNTVIDALFDGLARIRAAPPNDADCQQADDHKRLHPEAAIVLITGHRRESFGEPFRQFCEAIKETAARYPEALFVYPVHPNPNVREPVFRLLADLANVRLTEPKNYPAFLRLLDLSDIILTDSGGVQEEAPALGKPVLVTRYHTERPEGIASGHVSLIGPERTAILENLGRLLDRHRAGQRGMPPAFPYGDGHAAERCAASLMDCKVDEFAG